MYTNDGLDDSGVNAEQISLEENQFTTPKVTRKRSSLDSQIDNLAAQMAEIESPMYRHKRSKKRKNVFVTPDTPEYVGVNETSNGLAEEKTPVQNQLRQNPAPSNQIDRPERFDVHGRNDKNAELIERTTQLIIDSMYAKDPSKLNDINRLASICGLLPADRVSSSQIAPKKTRIEQPEQQKTVNSSNTQSVNELPIGLQNGSPSKSVNLNDNDTELELSISASETANSEAKNNQEWVFGENCALVCNYRLIAADAEEDIYESCGLIYEPKTHENEIKKCEKYAKFHTDVKYRFETLQKSNNKSISLEINELSEVNLKKVRSDEINHQYNEGNSIDENDYSPPGIPLKLILHTKNKNYCSVKFKKHIFQYHNPSAEFSQLEDQFVETGVDEYAGTSKLILSLHNFFQTKTWNLVDRKCYDSVVFRFEFDNEVIGLFNVRLLHTFDKPFAREYDFEEYLKDLSHDPRMLKRGKPSRGLTIEFGKHGNCIPFKQNPNADRTSPEVQHQPLIENNQQTGEYTGHRDEQVGTRTQDSRLSEGYRTDLRYTRPSQAMSRFRQLDEITTELSNTLDKEMNPDLVFGVKRTIMKKLQNQRDYS